MKKIWQITTGALLIGLAFFFLVYDYAGPHLNDRYKEELLKEFMEEVDPKFDVYEYSGQVIENGSQQIWIGAVINTDLTVSEIESALIQNNGDGSEIKCIAYSHEYAGTHGFTAIQKYLWEGSLDNYYFIFKVYDPKTKIDKRFFSSKERALPYVPWMKFFISETFFHQRIFNMLMAATRQAMNSPREPIISKTLFCNHSV